MRIKCFFILFVLGLVETSIEEKKENANYNIIPTEIKTVNPSLQLYERDIRFALEFLLQNEEIINNTLSGLKKTDKVEILSIVFPEIIRWNEFRDIIEISADRALYVNAQSKLGDFSLGHFQMKPSFIEALEKYISLNTDLGNVENIILDTNSEYEKRKERIKRLESFEWQLKYARVFWVVANHKFKNIAFLNKESKIRFLATAYNTGFMKPAVEIKVWENIKIFPYGKQEKDNPRAFADFSVEFLNIFNTYINN